eukprot:104543-Ditylum_brightwellii.AAC.1
MLTTSKGTDIIHLLTLPISYTISIIKNQQANEGILVVINAPCTTDAVPINSNVPQKNANDLLMDKEKRLFHPLNSEKLYQSVMDFQAAQCKKLCRRRKFLQHYNNKPNYTQQLEAIIVEMLNNPKKGL